MKYLLRTFAAIFLCFAFQISAYASTTQTPEPAISPSPVSKTAHESHVSKTVNINTADANTITNARLKGIGKKRAEAIVNYREQHGPFKSIEDLKNIRGISDKVLSENQDKIDIK